MLTLTIHMVRPGRDSTKGPLGARPRLRGRGRGPVGPVGAHYSYGEGEPAELSTIRPPSTHRFIWVRPGGPVGTQLRLRN